MEFLRLICSVLFVVAVFGVVLLFVLNPLILYISILLRGKKVIHTSDSLPSVSIIIVVHNEDSIIAEKITNSLSLKYPPELLEIVVFSDGSTDATEQHVAPFISEKVRFYAAPEQRGKNSALNNAVAQCYGEVLVFTDVDTRVEGDALLKLMQYFGDPSVGGVCGEKVIIKGEARLGDAQGVYTRFANMIKQLESSIGSISSNDGTLYAIRKKLFMPVPDGVTDDLYLCIAVVRQGFRFLYETAAKAFIKAPSRNPVHEIQRRRRIVCRSLRGISLQKTILNPLKYGIFSISLFINKVNRRLLPLYLLIILLCSLLLSFSSSLMLLLLLLQSIFYTTAFLYWKYLQHIRHLQLLKKMSSLVFYFSIGNIGTFLGLFDFLRGKQFRMWKPVKEDASNC